MDWFAPHVALNSIYDPQVKKTFHKNIKAVIYNLLNKNPLFDLPVE